MSLLFLRSVRQLGRIQVRTASRCLSSMPAPLPDHTKIIMPKVSPTMTVGKLVAWKKKEGEAISEGEDIADVESDKATMPIAARDDGFMAKIFIDEDTADIPLGELLAIVVEEKEHIEAFKGYESPSPPPSSYSSPARKTAPISSFQPSRSKSQSQKTNYSGPIGPAVWRLLNQFPDLNLNLVAPTGPRGRILKGDVLAAIDTGITSTTGAAVATDPSHPLPSETISIEERPKFTDVRLTSMRRAIAKRLNKTVVPHQYTSSTYKLDNLSEFRRRMNSAAKPDSKISVNDIVIKAVALALHRFPDMNVRWNRDTEKFLQNSSVDISMAVSINGGLITPIIPNAHRMGLSEIAKLTKVLIAKAKEGALEPEEYEGGSFSISNLGMLGVSHFSAIINPPQCGILAIGAPLPVARVDEGGNVIQALEGIATLSSDARAISQEIAADFLSEFCLYMSNPESMIA